MDIKLEPGTYVIAVSGGVDSVVLLDLLNHQTGLKLVVAHYDHGIRKDSVLDRQFVAGLAADHRLPFYFGEGKLGPGASEALARVKRYEFLRQIKHQVKAGAIVTAHHQDDRLETAILNMLRGTGRRGLSSLRSNKELLRPLLDQPKVVLVAYAKEHNLAWREDSTNQDDNYLRNYVRHKIMPKFSPPERKKLLAILEQSAHTNQEINRQLERLLADHLEANSLDKAWFISLPHDLSREVLLAWFRQSGRQIIDRRQIEQITVLLKTLPRDKLIDVDAAFQLKVEAKNLALIPRER